MLVDANWHRYCWMVQAYSGVYSGPAATFIPTIKLSTGYPQLYINTVLALAKLSTSYPQAMLVITNRPSVYLLT
jgi:hypothetical protein